MGTVTQSHALKGYQNPFLVCETCKEKVAYWHDPERCADDCVEDSFNHPCMHPIGVISLCATWTPGFGCLCVEKDSHKKI